MSKLGNELKMVCLLKSKGHMKAAEIAEALEVSERQVRTYRDDLEMAGIYIESKTGRYGGYDIEDSGLGEIGLTDAEMAIFNAVKEQLKYEKNMYASEFEAIFHKINATYNHKISVKEYARYFTIDSKRNVNDDEIKKLYAEINWAIVSKNKIKIDYFSLNANSRSIRTVCPYRINSYKGDLYITGFCEKRNEILDFKVCRIFELEVLDDSYELPKEGSLKERYSNCIGIFKDKNIDVKLKVKYPLSVIVSEKVWVENQKIKYNSDGTIIFEATMEGYKEIKSWIISMGAAVEVLKPEYLAKDISAEADEIKKIYKF